MMMKLLYMDLKVNCESVVVFDLDDTLYYEFDYLLSAFKEIAQEIDPSDSHLATTMASIFKNKEDVFKWLIRTYNLPEASGKSYLLAKYRHHIPKISLRPGALDRLSEIKDIGGKLGLLTDGRSITQRNKIEQLGILTYFDLIIISEEFGSTKPALRNYEAFNYLGSCFTYIADNSAKDFIAPNILGWNSICIEGEDRALYKSSEEIPSELRPLNTIKEFTELNIIK